MSSLNRPLGAAVRMTSLEKTFYSRTGTVKAVENVSLDVSAGQFVSLLGPSGCGKSTILNMVAGLSSVTNGTLTIDDQPVMEPIDDMGIVFQRDLLLEWRTVLDNVLLPLQIKRAQTQASQKQALDLLELVNLADFAHCYPHELSGGMRQRVAICRALITSPRLLLMDEPFAALDALTREQLGVDLLRIQTHYHPTVLFVTHSIDEAVLLSDTVIVLSARPARIVATFDIPLGKQRDALTRRKPEYLNVVSQVRAVLEEYAQGQYSTRNGFAANN
jgi:NitT/TauT family transport system ATP-binding protein